MITLYLKQFNKIIRNADLKIFDTLSVDDVLWIDMLDPSFKEQRSVETFMGISLQTRQQVEEIETTSKYSESEEAIVSNSNFFFPHAEGFSIEPVSFIISRSEALVSVHSVEMRTFRGAEKRLQMNPKLYTSGFHIFISLLEVRIDYDADLVEATAKLVAALSRDIATSEENIDKEIIRRIARLQEDTMMLRENIFDRQRVLWMIRRSERVPRDI